MKNTTYIIAAQHDVSTYVMTQPTPTAFANSKNNDAHQFDSDIAAMQVYQTLDEQTMVAAGWKGYHEMQLALIKQTVHPDGEVDVSVIAEKPVTIDTTGSAH